MLCKARLNKRMGTTARLNKLWTLLLIASISTLLSGCLVDKKKAEDKISRSTDTLHLYQSGEWIEYEVIEVKQTGMADNTRYGTMHVKWENTGDLNNPNEPGIISPGFKETTTITYDDNISGEPDTTVIRYISQITATAALNQGSIILHAIDDGINQYWPYDSTEAAALNYNAPVINPVILESPLSFSNTLSSAFSVMECNTGLCNNEIYAVSDNVNTVGDSREISTNLGIFSNPFQLSFSGGTTLRGTPALNFIGDIRDACGTSADTVTHFGSLFVMPEIGIIKIENNQCTNTSTIPSTIIYYTITARDTNIIF